MSRDYQKEPDHGGETMDLSEESLRQALARLGGGKASRPSGGQSGQHINTHQNQPARRAAGHTPLHLQGGDNRQESRRRRFVQDGQVVVEHQHSRSAASRANGVTQDDQDEIERLKQSVRREQRRCEEGERALNEARSTIRTLETRAAHADLHVQELDAQLRQRDERIGELMAQLRAVNAEKAPVVVVEAAPELQDILPVPRRSRVTQPRRPRNVKPALVDDAEPEPVKWWIRS